MNVLQGVLLLAIVTSLLPEAEFWLPPARKPCPPARVADTTPPKISNCTSPGVQYAKKLNDTAKVEWTVPQAYDEHDKQNAKVTQELPTDSSAKPLGPGSYFAKGNYTVLYWAQDKTGNKKNCTFYFEVKVRQCSAMNNPSHGHSRCPNGHIYGAECTFICDDGYYISDRDGRECILLDSGEMQWSGTEITCEVRTCEELQPVNIGTKTCTDGNNQNSICEFDCDGGYQRSGPAIITCIGEDSEPTAKFGKWDSDQPTCQDVEPPKLECPKDIVTYANFGTRYANNVTWGEPSVKDNSNEKLGLVLAGQPPGSQFSEGFHEIKYSATDSAGNSGNCAFTILVKVVTCTTLPYRQHLEEKCSSGFVYGSVCTFICDDGYSLDGNGSTECIRIGDSKNGLWDSEMPNCTPIQCQPLSPPDNGRFIGGTECGNTFNDWCFFECDTGYEITPKGNNGRRCMSSGKWDGVPQVCSVETCPAPLLYPGTMLMNSSSCPFQDLDLPYGSVCSFECSKGFKLEGIDPIVCGPGGRWQNPIPTCQDITCDTRDLLDPTNGYKTGCFGTVSFGAVCSLVCNHGYIPSNPVERVCIDDGNGFGVWNNDTITCEVVKCNQIEIPINGEVIGCNLRSEGNDVDSLQEYQSACQLRCKNGYTGSGSYVRTCLANGQWDGNQLQCTDTTAPEINCPSVQTVFAQEGQVSIVPPWQQWEPIMVTDAGLQYIATLVSYDSVVVEINNKSAIVFSEGTHSLIYQATDIAGNTGYCSFEVKAEVTRCRGFPSPQHGIVKFISGHGSCDDSVVFGSECQLTCEPGYQLSTLLPKLVRRCERRNNSVEGTWSSTLPYCIPLTCQIPNITNGYVSGCIGREVNYGTICTFNCDEGYTTSFTYNEASETCQADQTWSGNFFICDVRVTCPGPLTVLYGAVNPTECETDSNIPYDTVCNLECNSGYLQTGPHTTHCTNLGEWSHIPETFCTDTQEPRFLTSCPSYIHVDADYGETTAVVEFEQPTAVDNSGNVTVSRQIGHKGPGDVFQEGHTTVTFTATDPAGNYAQCSFTITVEVPRCLVVQVLSSGRVHCQGYHRGSSCVFSCNDGYERLGPERRRCERNATTLAMYWDNEETICNVVTCPAVETPANAITSGCSSGIDHFGTICTFYCDYGFEGYGISSTHCQADGTWSAHNFTCTEILCPALMPTTELDISPAKCQNKPSFGELCQFMCKMDGFSVDADGIRFVTCTANGTWSDDIANVGCVDEELPTFTTCPSGVTAYANRSSDVALVEWRVEARDNDGVNPAIECNHQSGMILSIGEYSIVCEATDLADNKNTCGFMVDVKVRHCQALPLPTWGITHGTCDSVYGSTCFVDCMDGFTLIGSNNLTCEYDGTSMFWHAEQTPTCQVTTCETLVLPDMVQVFPTFCAGPSDPPHGTSCSFHCLNGDTLIGNYTHDRVCMENGQWDRDIEESDMLCEDQLAPTISLCPDPIYVTLNDSTGVDITFNEPIATDNDGTEPNVTKFPEDITSPYRVVNDITLTYTFCDRSGNCGQCTFPVYVKNELPPLLVFCPPDKNITTHKTTTEVQWEEPVFHEPGGGILRISNQYGSSNQADFSWGTHSVEYQATNEENGKTAFCQFTIRIKPVSCPPLRSPQNGALACGDWGYGQFCNILCNENYDVDSTVPDTYVCVISSGMWSENHVPDCSESRRSTRSRMRSELYYSFQCQQLQLNESIYIAQTFLDLLLESNFGEGCTLSDDCGVGNVVVTCGDVSRRRKRSFEPGFHAVNVDHQRRRRSEKNGLPNRLKRSGQLLVIEFDLETNIHNDPSQDSVADVFDSEDRMFAMADKIQALIDDGGLQLEIDGQQLTVEPNSLTYGYAEIDCEIGFVADNIKYVCIACTTGTYYVQDSKECEMCPKGFYQDTMAALDCKPCPNGTSTVTEGARNVTDCIEQCLPGTHSQTGLEPCAECPIGQYQERWQQTACSNCPTGRTTAYQGSTSSQNCLEPCSPGTFSPNGLVPCIDCPRRYYQPDQKQLNCIICPNGLTTSGKRSTSFSNCTDVDECLSAPCQNGGTCENMIDSYYCTCNEGLTGINCEVNIDDCEFGPCFGNSTCRDGINGYTCECWPGYEGVQCDENINECDPNPCANGGTCEDLINGYVCHCNSTYVGVNCEVKIDFCKLNACLNNATCSSLYDGYACICTAGFAGLFCGVNIDECQSNPCKNGGTCVDNDDSYVCQCSAGYTGDDCATKVDLCADSPCHNNATCVDISNSISCVCPPGKQGELCERDITENEKEAYGCQNGAFVSITAAGINCVCVEGFVGPKCEVDYDECSSDPCSNDATCVDGVASYECICDSGFQGVHCGERVDACLSNPCLHSSTCVSDVNGVSCLCPNGFKGQFCEEEVNGCADNPCSGGTCFPGTNGSFTCQCNSGYTGFDCSININDCFPSPCLNGGTCIDVVDDVLCQCADGYSGNRCQVNIDDCENQQCMHDGTCIDGVNSFHCLCHVDYTGPLCAHKVNFCESHLCSNDGECIDGNGGYSCSCLSGYTGIDCEVNINECFSFPCVNAYSCTDGVDFYSCDCIPGWTGSNCNINIDDCALEPCQNGGQCVDLIADYRCFCSSGFDGYNCENNIDECAFHQCQNNAVCVDGVNEYQCKCPTGFFGRHCQIPEDNCHPNPCRNGGQCVVTPMGYNCTCLQGFAGNNCDTNVDDCRQNSCMNGAYCKDMVNDYYCSCPPGYTGKYCSYDINDCEPSPCANGGTCTDMVNHFFCTCRPGYTGDTCDVNINDCIPYPCINGGECIDEINGFSCNCPVGFSGEQCQINADECASSPCLNDATCVDKVDGYYCLCSPGYLGDQCAESLPSNFDLVSNGQLGEDGYSSVEVTSNKDIDAIVVGFWIRVHDDSGIMFSINIEYSSGTSSVFALNITQQGIEMGIGGDYVETSVTVHNGRWQHVTATWQGASGDIALHRNYAEEYSSPRFKVGMSLPKTGKWEVTCLSPNKDNFDLAITALNIWDDKLSEADKFVSATRCHSHIHGNIVSWTDFLGGISGDFALIAPSQCDDFDECTSNPCKHGGSCTDELHSFRCACPSGYYGARCESTSDVCDGNLCQHDSSCHQLNESYTCQCLPGFDGDYCQTPIVNGNWSPWGSWSPCSTSCDGGTIHRTRTCNDPPPINGGLDCVGSANDTTTCKKPRCNGCQKLRPPHRGFLHCNESNAFTECTVSCRPGYAFGDVPQPVYFCGYSTNWMWNHETLENPRARIPSCTKEIPALAIEASLSLPYPDLPCTQEEENQVIKNTTSQIIKDASGNDTCLNTGSCKIIDVKVHSCGDNDNSIGMIARRRRRATKVPYIEIELKQDIPQKGGNETLFNNESARSPVLDASASFEKLGFVLMGKIPAMEARGDLSIPIRDVPIVPDVDGVTGIAWNECPYGTVAVVHGFCTPCGVGTYLTWLEGWPGPHCHPCLIDTYQDEEEQEACLPCPEGTHTNGVRGATDVSECIEPPTQTLEDTTPTTDHIKVIPPTDFDTRLVVIISVVLLCVIGIIVTIITYIKRYKNRENAIMAMKEIPLKDAERIERYQHLERRPSSAASLDAFGVHLPPDIDGNDTLCEEMFASPEEMFGSKVGAICESKTD